MVTFLAFLFLMSLRACLATHFVTKLDESERWRQSVAVRLTTHGPDRPYDVLRTRRDSSVTVTFKRAVSSVLNSTKRCTPSRKKRCMLAHNTPGLVGQMHYTFADESRKIQGHSTQVLVACRCLDYSCREAIVLEPRRLVPVGEREELICTYPRVKGKWKDCHTELLRLHEIEVDDVHKVPDSNEFVVQLGVNNFWRTVGRRRYIRDLSRTKLKTLENMSFEDIIVDFEEKARTSTTSEFYVFGNDTLGDLQFPDELVVESGDAEECAKLWDYAQRSADWMGAQQDQLAIARNEDSFLIARPEEPSSSDAFLAIGAGLTGFFASIGIWAHMEHDMRTRGQRKMRKWSTLWIVFKAMLALFVIGVEVATLVFAWVTQNTAQSWISFFTWFDASVALSSSVKDCETQKKFFCSAARSVYVVTGLMGTAMSFHPNRSRWKWLLVSMVLIITASSVFVCAFFVKSYRLWKRSTRRGPSRWADGASRAALLVPLSKRDMRTINKLRRVGLRCVVRDAEVVHFESF